MSRPGSGVLALRPAEAIASVITDAAGGLATSPELGIPQPAEPLCG